jgi:ribosome-associated toxin RatA of RatAB toxin-antitoxin module
VKIIRFVLISIFSLFAIITAISLFIPSHVRISRAVNINAESETVLKEISDLNKWKKWYPGFDALTIVPVKEKDGNLTEARISSTSTSIVITARKADEVITQFNSGNNKSIISGWKTITFSSKDSLTVQWYLDFSLRWYPWEKFLSLTYDKMYGGQMEQGLSNLKKNVER